MTTQPHSVPEFEQLIFDSAVDGLVRAAKPDLTPSARIRLKELGLDVDAKLLPAYPAQRWAAFVQAMGEEIFAGLPPLEAQRRLAHRTVDVFKDGMLGSAMFAICRLVGPGRTIGRMTKNLRTGSNFVETRSTALAPNRYEIWINDVSGVPGFYMGLVERGLVHVGATGVTLGEPVVHAPSTTFEVGWDAVG